MKYNFFNDYSEGAHPNILKALEESNLIQETGYGLDSFSLKAQELVRALVKNKDVDVHLVSGGTQANLIVLASILKPYESIISATSGHINTHEAGAVEATGHKIDAIEAPDGKLTPELITNLVAEHEDEHMVKPRVVFISNSTEVGTIYKKKDIERLSAYCREHHLYLYLDGARLGSALTSSENDLTLADICSLTDVFYIGGTKNGAFLGEAIVIRNKELQKEFRRMMKQRGALLAKGRVLGIQFAELLRDNLFFDLAKHANEMAARLSSGIAKLGFKFLTNSPTNQIFPILPNRVIEKIQTMYGFYVWSKVDDKSSSIRLVTSWATKEEAVEEFLADIKSVVS
ncbi:MAG: low specificity L-threonine aldolase [Patescibacteria group bacterium]